ncbi:MAG: riboflavin synthase [Candidatus Thioglobus sp.]|nr:MAG: riboflavin synthase [Candidatus Thioglobus sp.]
MFTGIIQAIGQISGKIAGDKGAEFAFTTGNLDLSSVKIGDSIAVNGACLTVIELGDDYFKADVSAETLKLTTFDDLTLGDNVNLEKSLRLNQGIDGHLVSGHIDECGTVIDKVAEGKSVRFEISAPKSLVKYIVKKGSITLNGVSLTVNNIVADVFAVNIVPHTLSATTIGQLQIGDALNLEVDIIARHLEKLLNNKNHNEK